MTFADRSYKVARNFLQSVVVFDDLAAMKAADREAPPTLPTAETQDADGFGHAPTVLIPPADPAGPASDEAGVDVKRLTDAFAELGLICGFLRPNVNESQSEAGLLLEAARRADIVVLDWVINRDEGQTAREVIANLLQHDRAEERDRLRLVAIYTSQADLDEIVARIAQTMTEIPGPPPEVNDYVLTSGAARIIVLAKDSSDASGPAAGQRTTEEDLPKRLIESFRDFTMGLVPNVVLAGLAAVRTDSYRILGVLSPTLDPAYVAQTLLLRDASEAEDQLVQVLASELQSIMEDRAVGAEASADAIREWLGWRREKAALWGWGSVDANAFDEEVQAILAAGIRSDAALVERLRQREHISKKKAHVQTARLFAADEATAVEANDQFAMRFVLRTHYSKPTRSLELGTLLRREEDYLLCVQPVCDSVRLLEERDFPFLPLIKDPQQYDVVLRVGDERVPLRVDAKPHRIEQIRFAPSADKQCVVASQDGTDWMFLDLQGRKYVWVARLQTSHGQRVAHGLGSDFGRIGLDEAEWLREIASRAGD